MILIKRNNEYIRELLKMDEGQELDFKQSITNPKKIAKTICAFANTNGGILVIGVSDKRKIIGIDTEEERYMVEKAITDHCVPKIEAEMEVYEINALEDKKQEEEKYILLVKIKKSMLPTHYIQDTGGNKVYYVRKNDQSIPFNEPD